jgi:NAD dependent epimerase/dehydratase
MLKGKNVFVTGAAGFIGSHLVEELVKVNASVTAMIRYSSGSNWGNLEFLSDEMKSKITVVSGNIEDSDFMLHSLKGQNIVFHLAALIAIPYSYVAPRSYVRTNVEGTLNVMEAARRLGIERVVHTSTSEVYGTALYAPIDEKHPLQGQSPYSASKIGADKIAESYYLSFETPVVTLRPFNTYGPRQSARAFIPTVISQVLEQPAIRLGSLEPQRDMTFVRDTALGFIAAGTALGVEGETINLGVGETSSIGSIAHRILDLMDCKKVIEQDANRLRPVKSEVMKLVSDNSKAKNLLSWSPKVSLDDGLQETINFIKANVHLFKSNIYTV